MILSFIFFFIVAYGHLFDNAEHYGAAAISPGDKTDCHLLLGKITSNPPFLCFLLLRLFGLRKLQPEQKGKSKERGK